MCIIVSVVVLVVIVIISLAWARRKRRRAIGLELPTTVTPPQTLNVVPVWEIEAPTMESFVQDLAKKKPVLGLFTKGQLPNGVKIAVKVLNRKSYNRGAEEQFMVEVSTIGGTYHINLVRLYGFCHDNFMSALVYKYIENGSLDKHIFSDTQAIEREKLHEIAIGTTEGIAITYMKSVNRGSFTMT
ncbi:unnamed protein product [Camellia sinensis]